MVRRFFVFLSLSLLISRLLVRAGETYPKRVTYPNCIIAIEVFGKQDFTSERVYVEPFAHMLKSAGLCAGVVIALITQHVAHLSLCTKK